MFPLEIMQPIGSSKPKSTKCSALSFTEDVREWLQGLPHPCETPLLRPLYQSQNADGPASQIVQSLDMS